MIINNAQLSDNQINALDELVAIASKVDKGSPAIYKHLLILQRDVPSNFLYYTPAIDSKPAQLIGFLSLYFFYENKAEVSLLVHPDYRRQNIAKMLLEAANRLCKIKNIKTLIFSTPPTSYPPLLGIMGAKLEHREYYLALECDNFKPLLTTKLCVRHAKQQDMDTLCTIDSLCFAEEIIENIDEMRDRFLILLAEKSYHVLVAEKDGIVVGKVHLRFDEDEAFLSDLAIIPAQQHQGFGKELIMHAINYVISQNIKRIELEVETENEKALKLYLSCDFKIIDTVDFYVVNL